MALTAAQTAAFFQEQEEAQMGIPHPTVAQMQAEGITNVQDIADFDKESLQQLADNLRRPGGRSPNHNPNAAPGTTIPTSAFVFGAKSQKRLQVALVEERGMLPKVFLPMELLLETFNSLFKDNNNSNMLPGS
jgi:hypothetical protein